jgi:plastocyanin
MVTPSTCHRLDRYPLGFLFRLACRSGSFALPMETFDSLVSRAKVRRNGRLPAALRRAGLALALFSVPSVALAAVTAKGRVSGAEKLLNPVWAEAKDPTSHRYTFREPSPTVRPDVYTLTGHLPKELAVVVLGAKGAAQKVPVTVSIAGGRTTPVTVVVPEGQQIQFENKDPFPHKIYDTGNKGLNAVETAPAKSRAWTPPGPGKYEIRDQFAPSVRSWIVVEPRAIASTYPDRKGEFTVELEPGAYKLRGYFNGEPVGAELDVVITPFPAQDQPIKAPLVVGEAAK